MSLTIYSLIEAVWLIIPAYAANSFATLPRGHRRMDFNKNLFGSPVFGAGKTWEGFLFGVSVAIIIALMQQQAYMYLPWNASPIPLAIVPMGLFMGFLLGLGAMLGDLCGAFAKRRLGMKRGQPAPGLDQLDFVAGSLLAASILVAIQWEWVVVLAVLTPAIHLIANALGFLLKIKKEPY
jgi:CDP-2,3-bis-(O-geranylgeranyl)-sn-glycerol synthase